ncbi:MAG: enoyl-CoA hydratase/isomerase family protein [Gordonia polyisoprenivorans]|nr:enoyl-CoA hydratase/isomerase family protein [Gordonia polyisoprenivorans]
MSSQTLRLTLDDNGVIRLELTRAELMNPFDNEQHDDFVRAIAEIRRESDARSVLLSSAGRAFSAGGDVHFMQEVNSDPVRAREMIANGHELMSAFLALRVPVVTAVQGPAMGLGANLAFASDAVVAARTAKFADSHVRMGLVAGDGGVVVWPQVGGMMRAKRHLLTGDPLTAEDAFAAGMVTDLVDDIDELIPTALALATRLALLPPLAVQGTKQALARVLQQRAGEVLELSLQLERESMTSEDLMEATTAFLEKRSGQFKGR